MKFQNELIEVFFKNVENGHDGGQKQKLTKRQEDILEIIAQNLKISRKELSITLGINESAAETH